MTITWRDDMTFGNWRQGLANATALSPASRAADVDQQAPRYDEIIRQTWADTNRVRNQDASATNRIDAYDAANDRITAATGVSDLINPARDGAVPRLPGQPVMPGVPYPAEINGVGTTPVEQWKARIAELRQQHPDALDWDDIVERPERDAWAKMKELGEATELLDQRMGAIKGRDIPYLRNVPMVRDFAALTANFVRAPGQTAVQLGTGFAASMTSPIDAAVNVLGFSTGGKATALLKAATKNALANAGVQMPLSAFKMGDYKNAGLPYGWDVWLSEVEGAASAGFALDLAFRAPMRAVRAYRGETGLGGVLADAVPEIKIPPKPEAMVPPTPETIAASERGDLVATRQILEATGAIDDPEVRGALNRMETVGRIDAAALERLRELGVPRAEGMRILDGLVNGRYVRPADVAADVDRMTTPFPARIPDADAARVVDTARASLDALAPGLADMVTMAVEARAQSIEGPVRRALEALEGAKPDPARIAETLAREVRDVLGDQAEAERIGRMIRVASGSASSPEIARMVQDDPGLKASLNIDLSRHAEALALSTLSGSDLSRVLAGDVPPQVGAWIANHIPVAKHGEALDVIAKARPADMAEAVRLLDETVDQSNVSRATSLARPNGMSEPTGPELQRRVELMREDAAEAVKAAQEPIKERDKLDSKVEGLKGEIAKIEEKAAKRVEATVSTPDGSMRLTAEFEVVDAADLEAASGDLQPRDRAARAGSAAQVQEMAARLNPELLYRSVQSDRGAPIIDESGVVLSGNGRVAAINRAREMNASGYAAYRAMLAAEGFDLTGVINPVLVRRVVGLDDAAKRQFVVKSNRDDKLAMSAGELARADRDLITPDVLALLEPEGDRGVASADNRPFVRAVLEKMPAADRAAFQAEDGSLSPAGAARLEAAIFARAYDDRNLIGRLIEDQDGAGIRNALIGAAPGWAQMRSRAVPEYDITGNLVEAVQTILHIKERRQRLSDYLAQQDAFTPLSPATELLMRAFYNEAGTRAANWRSVRESLKNYARAADEQNNAVGDLLGAKPTAIEILEPIVRRGLDADEPKMMFALRYDERAEAAGFDTSRVWYHGTRASFDAFDPGAVLDRRAARDPYYAQAPRMVFLSSEPSLTSLFASGEGGAVMPLYLRRDARLFNGERDADALAAFLQANDAAIRERLVNRADEPDLVDAVRRGDWEILETPPVQEWLRAKGFDGFEAKGDMGMRRVPFAAVFDTGNARGLLRSVSAQFDPARADSANLLYSMTAADAPALAKKRAELHEAETQLADANLRLNPDPVSARELHAFAMRSIAIRREQDVRRAVAHAVMLGRTIAPEGTRIDVRTEEMRSDTGQLVEAYYAKSDGAIVLASYAADPTARMGHEVVHALVDVDALSPAEVKLLADEAVSSGVFTPDMRQRYADAYKDRANVDLLLQEEAAAHLIDARISGKAKGAENTIAGRLAQVIERLRNLIKGYGFRSREDVVAAVLNGEAARRAQQAEPVQRWMADHDVSAMAVRPGATPEQMFSLADRDTGRSMRRDMDVRPVEEAVTGQPIVLRAYRGMPDDNRGRFASHSGREVFLSSSPTVADKYTMSASAVKYGETDPVAGKVTPRIYPVHVDFKNPLVVDTRGSVWSEIPFDGDVMTTDQIAIRARQAGHDGVVFRNVMDGSSELASTIVALNRGSVFSATAGEVMFSLAGRDMDALGFYSKLDEVLAGLGPKDKVTAQTLQGKGVKAAEIEARGLMPMLAEGKAVSVADLRDTAGRNRVELREVERTRSQSARIEQRQAAHGADITEVLVNGGVAGEYYPDGGRLRVDHADGRSRLVDTADAAVAFIAARDDQDATKWSSYSLDPSNPTYRETVLHLPESVSARTAAREAYDKFADEMRAKYGEPGQFLFEMENNIPALERRKLNELSRAMEGADESNPSFQSGHFPEPNIIGHMMTSMVRHEGKPVYLIDQIQSDWGQRIRDQGGPAEDRSAKIASIKKQLDEFGLSPAAKRYIEGHQGELNLALANAVSGLRPNDPVRVELRAITPERRQEYYRLTAELKTLEKEGIAGNPLVNTTDQWTNTTLRRAIRQAAEADAAFIAIPSGKTVESYNPQGDSAGNAVFYDQIVPKNLRNLLAKIDKDAATAQRVDTLDTPTKGQAGFGFTLFPLTDKVKRSVIDDGQVMFAFAGERAKTADLEALARAKEMETAGTDRTAIWTDTGWFRGVDGKWRFEIDDSGAQLDLTGAIADGWQPNQKWPIDNVLTHRSLAAAYPDMNSRGIFYRDFPRGFDDAAASVTKTEGSIALNRRYRDFGSDERMLSSVMHEGQHVVQRSEGFARGGSPREFSPDELAAERARVLAIPEDPNSWNIGTASGDMSDLDAGRLLYRRLAGEVEARAVQKRFDMTAAERRARPPWMDYDVPEDQQIVRFADGSGPMFALADNDGAPAPRPILETEYGAIDRMNQMKNLIEACAA